MRPGTQHSRASERNARVSYRALALADGLPVQVFKDHSTTHGADCRKVADIFPLPSQRRYGACVYVFFVELMGIEPTASGLQNRRSPS